MCSFTRTDFQNAFTLNDIILFSRKQDTRKLETMEIHQGTKIINLTRTRGRKTNLVKKRS